MTQEDKDLLLQDLCTRLPYGVKILTYKLDYFHNQPSIETLYEINKDGYISTEESDTLRPIGKPYLFPLSSMTEEQRKEYDSIVFHIDIFSFEKLQKFYLKYHFDYHHLIDRNIDIDATGKNIY